MPNKNFKLVVHGKIIKQFFCEVFYYLILEMESEYYS